MPSISAFYGIIIRMYFAPTEHNPPHLHAYYSGKKGIFSIPEGEMIKGDIPSKQKKLIEAWIAIHQEELIANWQLSQEGENPYPIDPLK